LAERSSNRLERVGKCLSPVERGESRWPANASAPPGRSRDLPERTPKLVHDRKVGGPARARKRVEVDRDDALSESSQRLGPVAVFERDEADVRDEDPPPVHPGPVGR
jgi:hypothetical protein